MGNEQLLIRDRTEMERKAIGARHLDDLDLVIGRHGQLVAVACHNLDGINQQHVCWRCVEAFNDADPQLRRTEVKWGGTYIMLHAKCESPRAFVQVKANFEGMQYRRAVANVARRSGSIADAAAKAKAGNPTGIVT
jgi:hypothetical protein